MDAMKRMHTDLTQKLAKKEMVQITRTEAIYLQWALISKWNYGSETWPFKWGIGGLTGLGATGGIVINNACRKALNLKLEMKKSSYLPNAILPVMFIGIFHTLFVASKVLIGETKCKNCILAKATAFQLAFGMAFPLTLGPLSAMIVAQQSFAYDVPHFMEVKKVGRLWLDLLKKCRTRIAALSVAHVLLASFITYQEISAMNKIEAKLDELEAEENKNKVE